MPISETSLSPRHREGGDSSHRPRDARGVPSRPRVSLTQARRDPGSLSPQDLVALQRAIGNQAAGTILMSASRAAVTPSASLAVRQRVVEQTIEEPIRYFSSYERELIKDGHLSGPLPRSYETRDAAQARDSTMEGVWKTRAANGDEKGLETVWVKPWLVTLKYPDATVETPDGIDLHLIETQVADIWSQASVTLKYTAVEQREIAMKRLPEEYGSDQEFTEDLNETLRPLINSSSAVKNDVRKGVQVVFIPTNDRWGFTYHPGQKSGFNVPVTVVATKSAGVGPNRKLGEERLVPDREDLVPLDIVLDTAHEIGHALGLEHAETAKDVRLLMHKALYHTIGNAARMSKEKAEELLQVRVQKGEGMAGLYKRKAPIGDRPGEIWTMMHGPELSPEQVQAVLENVRAKQYLADHG